MIEEQALVLSVVEDSIYVRVDRKSACENCHLKSGCGQQVMTKLSSNQCIEFEVTNTLFAQAGDRVLVAIPEEGILKASFVVYFLPLISMLMFAIAAKSIVGVGDIFVAFFGVLGLVVGFIFARHYGKSHENDACFLPELVRIVA